MGATTFSSSFTSSASRVIVSITGSSIFSSTTTFGSSTTTMGGVITGFGTSCVTTTGCSFNFAFTSGFGEKQVTNWLNASLWGKRAINLAPMLTKGVKVGLVGELTNRPYKAKDGTEKFSLELRVGDLTLLSPKGDTNTQTTNNYAGNIPIRATDLEQNYRPMGKPILSGQGLWDGFNSANYIYPANYVINIFMMK